MATWQEALDALGATGVLPVSPLGPSQRNMDFTNKVRPPSPTLQLHNVAAVYATSDARLRPVAAPATLFAASVVVEQQCRALSTRERLPEWRSAAAAATGSLILNGFLNSISSSTTINGFNGTSTSASAPRAPPSSPSSPAPTSSRYAYLLQWSPEAIGTSLLGILDEPAHQRNWLTMRAGELGPQGVVEVLERCDRSTETTRTDTGEPRTPGGVFSVESKRYMHERREAAAQPLPPLQPLPQPPQPLRPYQRQAVARVLGSWGLPLPPELQDEAAGGGAGGGCGAGAGGAGAGGDAGRRNWLVAAPTGSGKTRVFVEVAKSLICHTRLHAGRGALVVVLVPTVLLTQQHAEAFRAAGLGVGAGAGLGAGVGDTAVRCHSSDNQLTAAVWGAYVAAAGLGGAGGAGGGGRSTVVVATADSFRNLLGRAVQREHVDLLIIDEAHHCHDDHAYAKIVAGLITPAPSLGGMDEDEDEDEDDEDDDDEDDDDEDDDDAMSPYLPSSSSSAVAAAAAEPRVLAVTASPAGDENMDELRRKMRALLCRLAASQHVVDEREAGVARVLAAPACRELHVRRRAEDLRLAQTLRDCTVEAALDVGLALQQLVLDSGAAAAKAAAGRSALLKKLEEAAEASEPNSQKSLLGEFIAQAAEFAAAHRYPLLELHCKLLDLLRKTEEHVEDAGYEGALPLLARKAAALCQAELQLGPGGGGDLPLRLSALVRRLLVEGGSRILPAAGDSAAALVRDCFLSGELQEHTTFPKFWALLKYLRGYEGRASFRGIVFVKTRQSVSYVADMVRRSKQLAFIEVLELIGQNAASKRRSRLPAEHERHGRGMNDREQQLVVRRFKEADAGSPCKLLVATSAAEEGLDVPTCEFVVRYNAAATGIQLLQSRGRARVPRASEFVNILQDGTLDVRHHARSLMQEENMRAYHAEQVALRQA
ncbi:hypothetical protein Agub_g9001 [Astrephomene gubernaculifera]|uniref:Uncharacterized protein n=1 Tax=Astrephomene gubernaculifera TaxID=47775 RepID=A0AAD3HMY0_9CHLO|nr:hypothetical protein Agub_g9001 [Astrephomene gubernaculifera]